MAAKRKAVPKIVRHSRRAVVNIAHANRNVRQAAQLAVNSGAVVNSRLMDMNQGELARMVPEKVIAAAAAGSASVQAAMRGMAQVYKDVTEEGIAALAVVQKVATARTPFEVLAIQSKAVCAAWDRMITRTFTTGEALMKAQWAVIAPIASAAGGNAKRLARA
jgi:hypothetical protein